MGKKWEKAIAMGLLAVCLASSMSACNVRMAETQVETQIERGTEAALDTEIETGGEKENGEEAGSGVEIKDDETLDTGTGTDAGAGSELKDDAETENGTETKAGIDMNTETGDDAGSKTGDVETGVEANSGEKAETGAGTGDGETLATPANSGALQVIGTQLCDKNGNPVQLRGISTHGLAWFPEYVSSELFEQFRNEWNANVMRLAMYTDENGGYCAGGNPDELKKLVKNGVRYATDNDMYVIIDWHVLNDRDPNVHIDDAKAFEISRKCQRNMQMQITCFTRSVMNPDRQAGMT